MNNSQHSNYWSMHSYVDFANKCDSQQAFQKRSYQQDQVNLINETGGSIDI